MKINTQKIARLSSRMQEMINDLRNNHTLVVHRNINETYYREKCAELALLKEQLEEACKKQEALQTRVCGLYAGIYNRWRKDARWLRRHLRSLRACTRSGQPD